MDKYSEIQILLPLIQQFEVRVQVYDSVDKKVNKITEFSAMTLRIDSLDHKLALKKSN